MRHVLPALLALPLMAQQPYIRIAQELDFGALLVDERGGQVQVSESGHLQMLGPGIQPGPRSEARELRVRLYGPAGRGFCLTLVPPSPSLEGPGSVRPQVASFLPGPGPITGTFSAQGDAEIRLGARLDIPAGTLPGRFRSLPIRLELRGAAGSDLEVSETCTLSLQVRPVLRITNMGPLDFGNLIPGEMPGRYRVDPQGTATSLDPGGPTQHRGHPRPAEFFISGSPGTDFSVEVPRELILKGPGGTLRVSDFTLSTPERGNLSPQGLHIKVGATLNLPPKQAPGPYSGQFTVTVNYN